MYQRLSLRLAAVLMAASMLLPAAIAAAPSPEVLTGVTTGQTPIVNQDVSGAKRKAVAVALELAVQNAFSSLVSRQVFAANLEFLYDRLLPSATDYVVTYRVLDGIQHQGRYLVGVESKVDLARIRQRLEEAKIIRAGQDRPVVLFLIAEQGPGDLLPRYWWGNNPEPYTSYAQTVINEQLAGNQATLACTGPDYPDPGFYSIRFNGIYDTRAALDLGRALKADLVVMGKAHSAESANRMGEAKAFEAVIDLTGFDLSSGSEVFKVRTEATTSSDVPAEGAAQALNHAAQDAAQDLGVKLKGYWSQAQRKESSFELVLEGEKFLPRFIALKGRLGEIRDITNMQPKEIGSSNAVLEVLYKGSPEKFADAVLLKTFDGFGIEIDAVTPEQVKIRFVDQTAGTNPEKVPAASSEKTAE